MSAAVSARGATPDGVTAKDAAALIVEHFRAYNEEFGRITRRAASTFSAATARPGTRCRGAHRTVRAARRAGSARAAQPARNSRSRPTCRLLGPTIKPPTSADRARVPDSDFYRTFYNSVTRDLFGTVGVNPEVEFCATNSRPRLRLGADPRLSGRRLAAVRGARRARRPAVRRGARRRRSRRASHHRRARPPFRDRPASAAPESIEMIEPVFYRRTHAFLVGRLIGDSAVTPLVISFTTLRRGRAGRCRAAVAQRHQLAVRLCQFLFSRRSAGGRCRGHACCARSCRASPSTSSTRCWAAPNRARRSATSRCGAISTAPSTAFVHAPGRARPGDDRVHAALARSGVQGDPRPLWRAQARHARRRHGALPVRVPPRSRRPHGRRPGIQAPEPAAGALHARCWPRNCCARPARAAGSKATI